MMYIKKQLIKKLKAGEMTRECSGCSTWTTFKKKDIKDYPYFKVGDSIDKRTILKEVCTLFSFYNLVESRNYKIIKEVLESGFKCPSCGDIYFFEEEPEVPEKNLSLSCKTVFKEHMGSGF